MASMPESAACAARASASALPSWEEPKGWLNFCLVLMAQHQYWAMAQLVVPEWSSLQCLLPACMGMHDDTQSHDDKTS